MKWYFVLHILNLYVLPMVGYAFMMTLNPLYDTTNITLTILTLYIPIGDFLISVLYAVRKRERLILFSFLMALLWIPPVFIYVLRGSDFVECLTGALICGYIYFTISLMGSMIGSRLCGLMKIVRKRIAEGK